MNFDKENIADDDRNTFLSDRAQQIEELKYKNFELVTAMENIKEVWIGSDGVKISTASEAYLERTCREMFLLASEALVK
jgi:hypothetical protein